MSVNNHYGNESVPVIETGGSAPPPSSRVGLWVIAALVALAVVAFVAYKLLGKTTSATSQSASPPTVQLASPPAAVRPAVTGKPAGATVATIPTARAQGETRLPQSVPTIRPAPAHAAARAVTQLRLPVPAFGNQGMLGIRKVFEKNGWRVAWDGSDQAIYCHKSPGQKAKIFLAGPMTINGQHVATKAHFLLKKGHLYAPASLFRTAAPVNVKDQSSRSLILRQQ